MKYTEPQGAKDKFPLIISVILHILILGIMLFGFEFTSTIQPAWHSDQVSPIQAVAVSNKAIEDQVNKIKAQERQKKLQELAQQRELEQQAVDAKLARKNEQERLAALEEQQRVAKQKLAAQQKLIEQQKVAELKAAAEQQRLVKIQKAQAVAKKKAQVLAAQKKKAELAKQEQTKQKKLALQKQLKQDVEQQMQQQVDADSQELAAAHSQEIDNQVTRYMALIKTSVESHWNKPDGTDPDLQCHLLVELTPGGNVINVTVDKTSGNETLDQSAVAAVYKSQPLPVPDNTDVFEQYFRKFIITA